MSRAGTRATARPGLRQDASPSTCEENIKEAAAPKSPRVEKGKKEGLSPRGRRRRTQDEISSDEELNGEDEVDRSANLSPRLYPDLDDLSPISPVKDGNEEVLEASFHSARTTCYPRGAHKSPAKRDVPLTPEKGGHGRKLIPDMQEKDEERRKGPTALVYLFFSFVVIVAFYSVMQSVAREQELQRQKYVKPIAQVYDDLRDHLKRIHSMFNQERSTWQQILSQLDSIMKESPTQPAVLLVVVPEDAQGTATCLIHTIAHAIAQAFGDPKFVMYDVKSNNIQPYSNMLKRELDDALMGLQDSHAAIVHNVESIPGRAAMIFHAYCDNENAPFKQAAIFPMVELKTRYIDIARDRLDIKLDTYLTRLWGGDLESKDVSSVVSRVANSPILIKPESDDHIRMLCPI